MLTIREKLIKILKEKIIENKYFYSLTKDNLN